MPFGIQLKGFIVGLVFAYLVIPWIQSFFARMRSPRPAQ